MTMVGHFHSLQILRSLLLTLPHLSSHLSSPLSSYIAPYYKSSGLLEPCKHSLVRRNFIHGFARPALLHGQLKPKTSLGSISSDVLCKVHSKRPIHGLLASMEQFSLTGCCSIHTSQPVDNTGQDVVEPQHNAGDVVSVDDNGKAKAKRKKLKGKRAVVRWLKFFRWKKKKEYERMTVEEKILYKLRKARRKEERFVQALKKLEPSETSETTHDPEVLTPEEHFYFLKMGHKCKNYVPVGRRGIFQGVILNMHLHWKKHQTLKVVVKTFTPEEVREIAAELARLSGGIVLDIHEGNTIIMYRGKNYAQPPTEIMSPRVTLSKKKALDKSKYRDALRAVRRYIPKLQQDLEDIQVQMQREGENKGKLSINKESPDAEGNGAISDHQLERFEELEVQEDGSNELEEDESLMESSTWSDSEDLSDIFETDSEGETEDKLEKPLYLDAVERFPSVNGGTPDDFEEHLRQIAAASKIGDSLEKDVKLEELDEIDKIFLRASSLLKRRRR
ncbi:uncharacterized CRM domain-containing protein At3g25440, chloroplastic isoform X3 [Phoenix dactylifera]|uniref:Uncharacterized CRM domain-containing protein At3g25440, chloroplastic isoform X3 n=1 Tax=Phoenix dactylifera TaxID=42345 RepID=A0A8B9AVM3_PHODC|nr:uncharacterized CRM domain-containing protein At3g25440, chloroplastic isoform X3 [Phoenix dactylifera]